MDMSYIPLYADCLRAMRRMTHEEIGQVIMAIADYADEGIIADLPGMAGMAFEFVKDKYDRDLQTYKRKSEQNAAKARKRWDATACRSMP